MKFERKHERTQATNHSQDLLGCRVSIPNRNSFVYLPGGSEKSAGISLGTGGDNQFLTAVVLGGGRSKVWDKISADPYSQQRAGFFISQRRENTGSPKQLVRPYVELFVGVELSKLKPKYYKYNSGLKAAISNALV